MNIPAQPSRHIVLGVTGGIAAYKTAELVRLLIKQGHRVQVVMTEAATQFITATTLQALSGRPVYIDQWAAGSDNGMPHIALSRDADAILIAPASADFIAKLAHGFANDLLSSLCLARECPLLVAPAMNKQMWENPATQRNIHTLQQEGIPCLGPASGEQACGEVGLGRMLEPEQLLDGLDAFFTPHLLVGKKILITAGATMEMLDPVRGITNLSSGTMGFALAKVATQMGAEVTLVYGHATVPRPQTHRAIFAGNAQQMYTNVMQQIASQDVMIAVAAVADYRPTSPAQQKIKKSEETLTLTLTKNKDIVADVASLPQPPYCIGFAAETEHVLEHAREKRLKKRLPLIVANHAPTAMNSPNNHVTLIDDDGEVTLESADKGTIAYGILGYLANKLG